MELTIRHLTRDELEAGLDAARSSPLDDGVLELIVRRPAVNAREVLDVGQLDLALGLVGDTWSARGSSRTDEGTPHPDMQLNIINSRVIQLIASIANAGRSPAISSTSISTSATPTCLPARVWRWARRSSR